MAEPAKANNSEDMKMLGAQIPESVFWKFKKAAADRKESMAEAILNAAMLYIEFKPGDGDTEIEFYAENLLYDRQVVKKK